MTGSFTTYGYTQQFIDSKRASSNNQIINLFMS